MVFPLERKCEMYKHETGGVALVLEKIREPFLKWFEHIKHKPSGDLVKIVDILSLTYTKNSRDRPKNLLCKSSWINLKLILLLKC